MLSNNTIIISYHFFFIQGINYLLYEKFYDFTIDRNNISQSGIVRKRGKVTGLTYDFVLAFTTPAPSEPWAIEIVRIDITQGNPWTNIPFYEFDDSCKCCK